MAAVRPRLRRARRPVGTATHHGHDRHPAHRPVRRVRRPGRRRPGHDRGTRRPRVLHRHALGILNQNSASSFLPSVVARDQLEPANAWLQAGLVVPSMFVGPALGGLLFVAAPSLPFTVDAVSYLVSAALVLSIRASRLPATEAPMAGLVAQMGEGLRWLWSSQVLRVLCLLLAVVNGTFAMVSGVLVLYAQEVLGLSERGYGLLLSVIACGTVVGTAGPGHRQRSPRPREDRASSDAVAGHRDARRGSNRVAHGGRRRLLRRGPRKRTVEHRHHQSATAHRSRPAARTGHQRLSHGRARRDAAGRARGRRARSRVQPDQHSGRRGRPLAAGHRGSAALVHGARRCRGARGQRRPGRPGHEPADRPSSA